MQLASFRTLTLNVKTVFTIIFVYLILEIVLNLLVRIFFGAPAPTPVEGKRVIDGVIGSGMVSNIIISILLIFATIIIFKADTKDIYLEKQKFSLSKFYYLFH